MTASDNDGNELQGMVKRVTMSDNEWQRMAMNDSEWEQW